MSNVHVVSSASKARRAYEDYRIITISGSTNNSNILEEFKKEIAFRGDKSNQIVLIDAQMWSQILCDKELIDSFKAELQFEKLLHDGCLGKFNNVSVYTDAFPSIVKYLPKNSFSFCHFSESQ